MFYSCRARLFTGIISYYLYSAYPNDLGAERCQLARRRRAATRAAAAAAAHRRPTPAPPVRFIVGPQQFSISPTHDANSLSSVSDNRLVDCEGLKIDRKNGRGVFAAEMCMQHSLSGTDQQVRPRARAVGIGCRSVSGGNRSAGCEVTNRQGDCMKQESAPRVQ
jgi:hypothetical protein